jgi:Flp pilus assembly pilin Flp
MKLVQKFIRDEQGLETVEYAIILGLIVAGTIGIIAAIGTWVNGRFATVQNDIGA